MSYNMNYNYQNNMNRFDQPNLIRNNDNNFGYVAPNPVDKNKEYLNYLKNQVRI